MASKFFLTGFFIISFLITLGFVSAEACSNVGEVDSTNNRYCDIDGQWESLKADAVSCLNDYECESSSCVEGLCGNIFEFITERTSLLQEFWNLIQGYECTLGEESCDGTNFLMCGANNVWENKGEVPGECGVAIPDTIAPETSITSNPSNPSNLTSATFTFTSTETGTFQCALDSSTAYSACTTPKSYTGLTAGSHTFNVKATDSAGNIDASPATYTWLINLTTPPTTPTQVCGNNVIEGSENCDNTALGGESCISQGYDGGTLSCYPSTSVNKCNLDTTLCTILEQLPEKEEPSYVCGDGTCNQRESSFTCPADCKPAPKKNYTWLFVVLLIIVLSGIGFVSFLIYKKLRSKRQQNL